MSPVAPKTRPVLLVALALLLTCARGSPQTGNGYDLTWSTIDGGGGRSTADPFILDGTAGQPDAALVGGGVYLLGGGFWAGVTTASGNCAGDCGHDGTVTMDEIITLMRVALGSAATTTCDGASPGGVSVAAILAAVNNAVTRCP